jgi:hypothetical protein
MAMRRCGSLLSPLAPDILTPMRFHLPRPNPSRPFASFLMGGMAWGGNPAWACAACRPAVKAQVYDSHFLANLSALLLPMLGLALVALAIHGWDRWKINGRTGKDDSGMERQGRGATFEGG